MSDTDENQCIQCLQHVRVCECWFGQHRQQLAAAREEAENWRKHADAGWAKCEQNRVEAENYRTGYLQQRTRAEEYVAERDALRRQLAAIEAPTTEDVEAVARAIGGAATYGAHHLARAAIAVIAERVRGAGTQEVDRG